MAQNRTCPKEQEKIFEETTKQTPEVWEKMLDNVLEDLVKQKNLEKIKAMMAQPVLENAESTPKKTQ